MRFQVLFAHPTGHLCRVVIIHEPVNYFTDWVQPVQARAYEELATAQCRPLEDVVLDTCCLAVLSDYTDLAWLNPAGCR